MTSRMSTQQRIAQFAISKDLHSAKVAPLSCILILLSHSAEFDTMLTTATFLLSSLTTLSVWGTTFNWCAFYLNSCLRGVHQDLIHSHRLFSLHSLCPSSITSCLTYLEWWHPPHTQVSASICAYPQEILSLMVNHQLKLEWTKTEMLYVTAQSCTLMAEFWACRFFFGKIQEICPFVNTYLTKTLVQALVISYLYYWKPSLLSLSVSAIRHMQLA